MHHQYQGLHLCMCASMTEDPYQKSCDILVDLVKKTLCHMRLDKTRPARVRPLSHTSCQFLASALYQLHRLLLAKLVGEKIYSDIHPVIHCHSILLITNKSHGIVFAALNDSCILPWQRSIHPPFLCTAKHQQRQEPQHEQDRGRFREIPRQHEREQQ